MFGRMKVGTKILFGYIFMTLVFSGFALYTYVNLQTLASLQDEGASRSIDAERAIEASGSSDKLYTIVADAVINRDLAASAKTWDEEFKKQSTLFEEMAKSVDTAAEKAEAQQGKEALMAMATLFEKEMMPALKAARPDQVPSELQAMDSRMDSIRGKAEAATTAIAESLRKEAVDADKAYDAVRGKVVLVSIFLSIFTVAFGVLAGLLLSRSISAVISASVESLRTVAAQVLGATEQLSSAAQQLASGAAEQASSIEETTASLEEMGGMVANNVDNATRASELSQRVAHVSEQGNETMLKMQESMKEILASNEKIEQLVKVISAIGEKTQVMDEIVFQTKLLSFNASVEAERAGEHGRGFAVVAQEVGNLAQMSGKAAQEIAQILADSLRSAEVITTENKKKVENGAHFVSETGAALKEILGSATTVTTGANQVLEASKEQAAGIKQVNVAMNNLEKSTQENAALAEEVASTSEELSAQTDSLNNSVLDLDRVINGDKAGASNWQTGRASPPAVARASTHTIQTAHHAPSRVGQTNVHDLAHTRAKRAARAAPQAGKVSKRAVGSDLEPEGSGGQNDGDAWEKL